MKPSELWSRVTSFAASRAVQRYVPAFWFVLVGSLAWLAIVWLPVARQGLEARQTAVVHDLATLQDQITEINRLRGQKPGAALTGEALKAALTTSLAGDTLALEVVALDAEALNLKGTCDFNRFVQWLGKTQHIYPLSLDRLSIKSAGQGAVALEAKLSVARP